MPDESLAPGLRLIMNLIPSNVMQYMITGDLRQLPSPGQWHAAVLFHAEVMLLSGSDRKCFFYI